MMRLQARQLAFTTLIFAAFGSLTAAAYADAPASAPNFGTPNSNVGVTGPTVQGQEVTAFSGRTPDPYFLAKGVPLGGPFRLFPNLFVGLSYDDNVFRRPTTVPSTTVGDFFFTINPTLVLDYDTSRTRVDLYADANIYQFLKRTTLNATNYDFGLLGQYEVSAAANVRGNVSYSQLSEPLSSANSANQISPTQYTVFDVSGQGHYQPNRLGLTVGGSFDSYKFDNVKLPGGIIAGNKDRNNDVAVGFAQVNYDFSPGYTAFIRAVANDDQYKTQPDRAGIFRSSHGYKFDAGVSMLLGNLIQGQLFLGYVDQLYNQHHTFTIGADPAVRTLKDIGGLDFGADVLWFPTELLTVHLAAQRQLQSTTIAGASAGDDRGVSLGLQYELTRQISLTGRASYDDTMYKGTATTVPLRPDRDDQIYDIGVGGKWLITHYISASVNFDHSNRSSNIPGAGFSDNTVMVGVNLQI